MNYDAIVKELRGLRRLREDLDSEIAGLEDQLKEEMRRQQVDELRGSDWKVTWKYVKSQRVDTTAFKEAMPDVAAGFMVTSCSRRFCLK